MFGIYFVFIERWLNDGSGRQERGAARPPASRLNRNSGHSYPPGRGRLALPGLAGAALLALVLCAGDARAQAVCGDTPGTGNWIACEESAGSADDIDIDADGVAIGTTEDDAHGVSAKHEGTANIDINVGPDISDQHSTITTAGARADGIEARHTGTGNINISTELTTIETNGERAYGVVSRHHGIGDIDITLTGGTIHATGAGAHGVFSRHFGTGDTVVTLQDGTTITTGNNNPIAHAVFAERTALSGAGDITITTKGAAITTESRQSYGVFGHQDDLTTSGDITIDAQGGTINVTGNGSIGIAAWKEGGMGDVTIGARNITIDAVQYGVYGHDQSSDTGDVSINVEDLAITTTGTSLSHGVFGWRRGSGGGAITIDVQGGSITTNGLVSHGLYGEHQSTGDVNITTRGGVAITTESVETDPDYLDTFSHGVYGLHTGSIGSIDIDALQGSSITAKGTISHGVYARHTGTGDITITTSATVATEGPGGHGVYAELDSGMGEIGVSVGGGSVTASGVGSKGVKVGRVAVTDHDMDPNTADINVPQRAAEVGEDGYRMQTVTVNGPVMGGSGEAAGVYLAGGGRVVIGPKGSVGAASGIAILATGDTPGANPGDPVIKPKLLVDMDLDDRRVAEVLGDDWIINDGGETTIVVNGEKLHDGETGVVEDAVARNGAWNVTMLAEGFKVTDRADPDPANWIISKPAAGVVADRDFSAGDFNETDRPKPPPPPPPPPPQTCPEGQVGTPPDCVTPPKRVSDGSGKAVSVFLRGGGRVVKYVFGGLGDAAADFLTGGGQVAGEQVAGVIETRGSSNLHEVYAPRTALYEALPGFLLRLNGGGPEGERLRSPGSPVWARLSGSRGSHSPDRSTVGKEYDFERFTAEAGLDVSLGESLTGSISLIHVRGSAEVSSPFGGGDIEVKGIGVSLGASWTGAGGYYANGSLSLTNYDVELASGDRSVGTLKKNAAARGTLLNLEAGRRIKMSERLNLTPRAWMTRSGVSIDTFTDSVDARVSAAETARFTGGVGVAAGTERAPSKAACSPCGDRWTSSRNSTTRRRPSTCRERGSNRNPKRPGSCWDWAASTARAASR